MTTNTEFKLTFNKPVEDAFMRGDDSDGLKVKIDGKEIFFLPVTVGLDTNHPDYPSDVIPLDQRVDARGGLEANVEGYEADTLLNLLTDMNPDSRYFLVERTKGGWLALKPHTKTSAPPRPVPHMRVWTDEPAASHPIETAVQSELLSKPVMEMSLNDIVAMQNLIAEHEATRQRGRPPREISMMRGLISTFAEKAMTVVAGDDQRSIALQNALEAADQLKALLSTVVGVKSEPKPEPKPVRSPEPKPAVKAVAKPEPKPAPAPSPVRASAKPPAQTPMPTKPATSRTPIQQSQSEKARANQVEVTEADMERVSRQIGLRTGKGAPQKGRFTHSYIGA